MLGYLKQVLRKRRDLKVIITSATIDPERFSQHFDKAPIIHAEGRTYPVELRYREPEENSDSLDDIDLPNAVLAAAEELLKERQHDILVFLSGEREIREINDLLSKEGSHNRVFRGVDIVPLYSRLSCGTESHLPET